MLKKLIIVLGLYTSASHCMDKQNLTPLDPIKACIIEEARQLYAHDDTTRVYFVKSSLYIECLAELAKTISTDCPTLTTDNSNQIKNLEYFSNKDYNECLHACDYEEVNFSPRDLFHRLLNTIALTRVSKEGEFPPQYHVKLNGIDTLLQILKSNKLPHDPLKNQKENYERKKQSGYELTSSIDFEKDHSQHHSQVKTDLDTLTRKILTKYGEHKKYPLYPGCKMILDKSFTCYQGSLVGPSGESFSIHTSQSLTSSELYIRCKEQLPDEIVDQAFDGNGNLHNGWTLKNFGVLEGNKR